MAVELFARIDPKDLAQFGALNGNVRIAAAIGLTKVAKEAQTALKDEAASVFHLRNSWVPKGFRIEPATAAKLSARVGSIDLYMDRHVDGLDKDAAKALNVSSTRDAQGRYATGGLLIGLYANIGDAKTHTQERRMLARINDQKNKTFQIVGRGGTVLIARRIPKRGRGARGGDTGLQILAVLKNNVKDRPILPMEATVSTIATARFLPAFSAAIEVGRRHGAR